jgi:hypothetical protein
MDEMQGSASAGNPAANDAAGTQALSGQQMFNNGSTNVQQTNGESGQTGNQWYSQMSEEARGFVQTKGWQSPDDVVQSYTNLEKLLGADKAGRGVIMPKEDAAPEEWGKFYDRLGRPASPEEYKLPVPQGDTGQFAKVAANKFHELGITAKQAQSLAEWWNSQSQEMQTSQMNQQAQNSEMEMQVLQSEWGKEFDANIEAARRATRQFGVEEGVLEKIEGAIGTREMLKLFANIGKGMGEDSFVDSTKSAGFGISPEAARVRISQLKADKDWSAKYLSGNADAKAEMERLMRAAYPR